MDGELQELRSHLTATSSQLESSEDLIQRYEAEICAFEERVTSLTDQGKNSTLWVLDVYPYTGYNSKLSVLDVYPYVPG